MKTMMVAVAAAAVLFSGCGGGDEKPAAESKPASTTSSATTTSAKQADESYGSAMAVVGAMAVAGQECPNPVEGTPAKYAAQTVNCDGGIVVSTYASETDRQEGINLVKKANGLASTVASYGSRTVDPTLILRALFGKNWSVMAGPDVLEKLQPSMGGTIVGN